MDEDFRTRSQMHNSGSGEFKENIFLNAMIHLKKKKSEEVAGMLGELDSWRRIQYVYPLRYLES